VRYCVQSALDGRSSTSARSVESPDLPDVVLVCEHRAEEWHFDESVLEHRTTALREQARAHRCREGEAKEEQARVGRRSDEHAEELCGAIEAEERKRAKQLSAMREECVEVQARTEELMANCAERVREIQCEVVAERGRRSEVEQKIRDERRYVDEAKSRIAATEERERDELRVKDDQIRHIRAEGQRAVQRLEREAEEKVREIETATDKRLKMLRRIIQQDLRSTANSASEEVRARTTTIIEAWEAAESMSKTVAMNVNAAHSTVHDVHEETARRLQEIQVRDFDHEHRLNDHIDAALAAVHCSEDELKKASVGEKETSKQRRAATDALGGVFAASSQFNVHFNAKLEEKMRSGLAIVAGQD